MSEPKTNIKETINEKRMRKREEKAVKKEAKESVTDPREHINSILTFLMETKESIVLKDESTIMMGTALAMQIRPMRDYEIQELLRHIENNDFSNILKALPLEEGVKMLTNVSKRLAMMMIADIGFSMGVKERHIRESIARVMLAITMLENEKDMDAFNNLYGTADDEGVAPGSGDSNA